MIIYQIHEKHGRHMACSHTEADTNEENGWKTVTEAEFYGESTPKVVEQEEVDEVEETHEAEEETGEEVQIPHDVLVELYEAKFGEKPHHRMKDNTIKKKIETE